MKLKSFKDDFEPTKIKKCKISDGSKKNSWKYDHSGAKKIPEV